MSTPSVKPLARSVWEVSQAGQPPFLLILDGNSLSIHSQVPRSVDAFQDLIRELLAVSQADLSRD